MNISVKAGLQANKKSFETMTTNSNKTAKNKKIIREILEGPEEPARCEGGYPTTIPKQRSYFCE